MNMKRLSHALNLLLALGALCTLASVQAAPASAAPMAPAADPHGPVHGAGVDIRHTLERAGADTVLVTLRLSGASDPAGATFRYTATGGARLLQADSTPLAAGAAGTREVRVRIDASGAPHLNVFTTQAGRTAVLSIPLVDDPARLKAAPAGSAGRGPAGERLIVVPGVLRP